MKINERMTPKQSIVFVIVIGIAVFIAMPVVYGQEGNTTKLLENSSQQTMTLGESVALSNHIKVLEGLLNYCFEHASDSVNPIQDLVDKGLINGIYSGKTCADIRLDREQALLNFEIPDLEKKSKQEMLKDRFDALRDKQQKALEGLENK
jgi:hypothetical protein